MCDAWHGTAQASHFTGEVHGILGEVRKYALEAVTETKLVLPMPLPRPGPLPLSLPPLESSISRTKVRIYVEDVSALMAADPKLDKLIKSTAKMLLCIQQVSRSSHSAHSGGARTHVRRSRTRLAPGLSVCRGKFLPRPKAKSARQ